MNDRTSLFAVTLSIAAVERDTGLSKDTLRVWERRYGFPAPMRDAAGERTYTLAEVEKLRVVKRLLDAGHRAGRIVPLSVDELQHLSEKTVGRQAQGVEAAMGSDDVRDHLEMIRAHDVGALRSQFGRLLSRVGLARFVIEVVVPLNAAVGDAWLRGQMEVFEEHQYTETMQGLLRQAIAGIPMAAPSAEPRVLLTTMPGEPHSMGLLMAEALLTLEGCSCVSLGVETPVWDAVRAAKAYRTQIVGLTFTGCMGPNQIVEAMAEMRTKLPDSTDLWVGGSAPVLHRRPLCGATAFLSLDQLPVELRRWRSKNMTARDSADATSLEC